MMTMSPSTQSPIHNRLKGVFFTCNLCGGIGRLPDISPFGSERVKITITNFADSKLHLFYDSHHYTKNTICYAILVLVKESGRDCRFHWDHMIELDLKSNPFIQLDFEHSCFQYCDPSNFNLWVELFVAGDVQLMVFNHTWDTVTDTGRHKPVQQAEREMDDDCDDVDNQYDHDAYDHDYDDEYDPDNDEDAYAHMFGDDSDLDEYHDNDYDDFLNHDYSDNCDQDKDEYNPGYEDD